MMKEYRYLATSREGFIQQVATSYVNRGYRFYVPIQIPDAKDPRLVDEKMLDIYDIRMDSGKRFRRKQKGLANVQYIRFGHFALLLATHGKHKFFEREKEKFRDCSREAMVALGYGIRFAQGGYLLRANDGEAKRDVKERVRVTIARSLFKELRAELVGVARQRRPEWFAWRFWNMGFEPYAAVRKQQLHLLSIVNSERKQAGLSKIPMDVIRYRRKIVKPFELREISEAA